ncbi:MAG: SGNH/GDSL hydrolase family protein [Verrucomicrobia bacterium]|nr:SGNH/GDSL hydrolase family protein [Verrucomicrobiota bacterium]
MKKLAVLRALFPVILLTSSIASAFELSKVHNLVVFGDSLSDNGNTYAAVGIPKSPYYKGRWTNGYNWVDYFTRIAGLPPATAFLETGGTNFAVGGSTSELLGAQILVYLATVGGKPDPADLFVIWIGGNDFLAGIDPDVTSGAIGTEIAVLSLVGAQQFLVINVPDISLTPDIIAMGTAKVQAAKQFVTTVNSQLQTEIPYLASLYGVKIDLIDVNQLFTELVNDPGAYGFKNSTGEAYNPSTGKEVKNPNHYVFWDGFHPTTRVHKLAAETFEKDAAAAVKPLLGANP